MASSKTASTATSRTTISGLRAGGNKARRSSSRSITRAATKARPIEIRFRADIPAALLDGFRAQYAEWILPASEDEVLVDWASTGLSQQIASRMTAGACLNALREAHGWTQRHLGTLLGGVSPARISDWEHDRRALSKDVAKQLSGLFGVPVERFL